jgi:hypothetical protein
LALAAAANWWILGILTTDTIVDTTFAQVEHLVLVMHNQR